MLRIYHSLFLVIVMVSPAGCDRSVAITEKHDSLAGQIGRQCVIQFRRGDAMGVSATDPIPPEAGVQKSAEVAIQGTLRALDGEYLILRQNKTIIWVPQSSILLVRFDESP
ncbi:MAG: hypothetical protein B7Z73_12370 [Planctomycetia bacterium 21-64-5]|nr:MAG: hypothetical protein B7Z73_12370 [Planctomycetia bacterium 21-64-5]